MRFLRWTMAASAAATLVACGGSDPGPPLDPSTPSSGSFYGLAATGAAIKGGAVTAKCVSGPELTGTTGSSDADAGSYTLPLTPAHTAPCIVKVTQGSTTLFSFAEAAGRVNINPLTDTAVAAALGDDPEAALIGWNADRARAVADKLPESKQYAIDQFKSITGQTFGVDPFAAQFVVGDDNDKVLDAFGDALKAATGKTYADVRQAAQEEKDLTTVVPKPTTPSGFKSFFGTKKTATDVSMLEGLSFSGTNCMATFSNGTLTVTNTSTNKSASASFSGDEMDKIIATSGNGQIAFRPTDGGITERNGQPVFATGTPSSSGEIEITNYAGQSTVVKAYVNSSDGSNNITGAFCEPATSVSVPVPNWTRPVLSSGQLNFLETYSTDLSQVVTAQTHLPKLQGTWTSTAKMSSYKKVQIKPAIAVLDNLTSKSCTLTIAANGDTTVDVEGHSATYNLLGKSIWFWGGLMEPVVALDQQYVKGYQITDGIVVGGRTLLWSDSATYEGPVELTNYKVTSSDGSYREEWECYLK